MAKTRTASFILSLCTSLSILSLISAFSPIDHYLVNCGSSVAETLDSDHRTFAGDAPRFSTSTRTIELENSNSQLDLSSPLYHTARAFNGPARYAFPIRDHRGTHHLVRLHFHPIHNNHFNFREAEFHVLANSFLLLHNFRILETDDFPIIKEFIIPVNSEKLEVTFMPSESSHFGFVNAVEVISAPKDMIADVADFVDSEKNGRITGVSRNGFETVHRVNVGGLKVTPFNDSLWRTWVTDDKYLSKGYGLEKIEKVHFGGRINYQIGGASVEVGPDNVYNTARVIKSSDNAISKFNITWEFEVEKGYRYMVRTHFCDIVSAAMDLLYFNIYVNGKLAYENLDLSEATKRLASPFYVDFVVDEVSSEILEVSVGPSNMSLPRAAHGILNGVEIWKMNNSMGSFMGETVCAKFVRESWRKEHARILLPLVAFAVFLMLTASLLQRRRISSVGWSRLPTDVSEANLKCGNQLASGIKV